MGEDRNKHIMGKGVVMPEQMPDDLIDDITKEAERFLQGLLPITSIEDISEKKIDDFVNDFARQHGGDPAGTWGEAERTLKSVIQDSIRVSYLYSIYETLKPYIEKELQKPVYSGMSLRDMAEGYHNAEFGGGYLYNLYQTAIDNAYMALEVDKLKPYIDTELEKPEYNGMTLSQVYASSLEGASDLFGDHIMQGSLFQKLMNAARDASTEDNKIEYRTASRAGDDIKRDLPAIIASVTLDNYENATRIQETRTGNAYLQKLSTMDNLTFKDGHLFFTGSDQAREISSAELQNLVTREGIENINLSLLRYYYSIIYSEWERHAKTAAATGYKLPRVISIYVPDLLESRGLDRNAGQTSVDAIISEIKEFHNIVGVLHVRGRRQPSLWPVLNFEGYDAQKNIILISSPYIQYVLQEIVTAAIRTNKKNEPLLDNYGMPKLKPINHYLVKAEIQKERNKAAVENVFIICQGIAKAGAKSGGFHISAETLMQRNALMAYLYSRDSNKNRYLQKVFKKTWELLRDKTTLTERYKNIVLPDPDNPKNIPTKSVLKTFVIEIRHEGFASKE